MMTGQKIDPAVFDRFRPVIPLVTLVETPENAFRATIPTLDAVSGEPPEKTAITQAWDGWDGHFPLSHDAQEAGDESEDLDIRTRVSPKQPSQPSQHDSGPQKQAASPVPDGGEPRRCCDCHHADNLGYGDPLAGLLECRAGRGFHWGCKAHPCLLYEKRNVGLNPLAQNGLMPASLA